ncbi:dihydrofolate reductase family protein [Streptomyces sp. T-3]|nr:dihydrofolate reductase family protein [Streptomyces sp. T-3]
MKLTLTQFVTLDGVFQAPGGPEEDTSGGFTHGGWSVPYGDEDFGVFMTEVFERADAFLLGRGTYEIFAGHWPKVSGDIVSDKLNALPKYVASTTLKSVDWNNSHLIGADDLAKDVTALKEQDGREVQLHGSGNLARSLFEHDLIDTVHLLTFPVALGSGKRLFAEGGLPAAFTLAQSRTTSTGVVISTYELKGRPEYGSYALDQ